MSMNLRLVARDIQPGDVIGGQFGFEPDRGGPRTVASIGRAERGYRINFTDGTWYYASPGQKWDVTR